LIFVKGAAALYAAGIGIFAKCGTSCCSHTDLTQLNTFLLFI
jgi:hypothetical protein